MPRISITTGENGKALGSVIKIDDREIDNITAINLSMEAGGSAILSIQRFLHDGTDVVKLNDHQLAVAIETLVFRGSFQMDGMLIGAVMERSRPEDQEVAPLDLPLGFYPNEQN